MTRWLTSNCYGLTSDIGFGCIHSMHVYGSISWYWINQMVPSTIRMKWWNIHRHVTLVSMNAQTLVVIINYCLIIFLMQLLWSDLILSLHSCSFFSWSSGCNFFIDLLQDWLLSHLELKLVILLAAVKKEKKINIKRLESFLIQVVMHQKINGSEIGLKAATLVLRPKAETMTLLVE